MEPLKYSILSTTTKGSTLYIHEEKQSYRYQYKTQNGLTYRCKSYGCNCLVEKINLDCFRKNPETNHNHTKNSEEYFKRKLKHFFTLQMMRKILSQHGQIIIPIAKEEIESKIGKINVRTLHNIKYGLTKRKDKIYTGTYLKVEPVKIIPFNKIQRSRRN